jgi:hypothetical protein
MTIEFGAPRIIDLTDEVEEDFSGEPTVSQSAPTAVVDPFDLLRRTDPKCRAEYQAFFRGAF